MFFPCPKPPPMDPTVNKCPQHQFWWCLHMFTYPRPTRIPPCMPYPPIWHPQHLRWWAVAGVDISSLWAVTGISYKNLATMAVISLSLSLISSLSSILISSSCSHLMPVGYYPTPLLGWYHLTGVSCPCGLPNPSAGRCSAGISFWGGLRSWGFSCHHSLCRH